MEEEQELVQMGRRRIAEGKVEEVGNEIMRKQGSFELSGAKMTIEEMNRTAKREVKEYVDEKNI